MTIRSTGAQEMIRKQFDEHQDLHTSTYSLIITISTVFSFALDVVSVGFIAIVTYSFVALNNGNFLLQLSILKNVSIIIECLQIFAFARKHFCRECRFSNLASAHFVQYDTVWNAPSH